MAITEHVFTHSLYDAHHRGLFATLGISLTLVSRETSGTASRAACRLRSIACPPLAFTERSEAPSGTPSTLDFGSTWIAASNRIRRKRPLTADRPSTAGQEGRPPSAGQETDPSGQQPPGPINTAPNPRSDPAVHHPQEQTDDVSRGTGRNAVPGVRYLHALFHVKPRLTRPLRDTSSSPVSCETAGHPGDTPALPPLCVSRETQRFPSDRPTPPPFHVSGETPAFRFDHHVSLPSRVSRETVSRTWAEDGAEQSVGVLTARPPALSAIFNCGRRQPERGTPTRVGERSVRFRSMATRPMAHYMAAYCRRHGTSLPGHDSCWFPAWELMTAGIAGVMTTQPKQSDAHR